MEASKISQNSFILFVDDGSKDTTWNLIEKLSKQNSLIKGIKLSKNQGHQNAVIAGMEYVADKCDCLITIDADLQDDINVIPQMVAEFINGSQVVYGVRKERTTDTVFKKFTAELFYKIMLELGVDIVYNHADFRLLSKKANKYVLEFKERNLFLRGIVKLVGLKTSILKYEISDRLAGESKYTFKKMLSFAWDGITSFSSTPLHLITLIGILICFFSFFAIVYTIIVALFTDKVVQGWASIMVTICFMGGVQLLSLGVIGEYVAKIYKETKQRPRYFIEEEIK